MDLSLITTYRCNSRCSMCHIWKYPTLPEYEVSLEALKKLPSGFGFINVTGGEPTQRKDLLEICDILYPKTLGLEISTNGLNAEPLLKVINKYPNVKIRISIDGLNDTNNEIRGEKDGFNKKINTMEKLIKAGGKDLGFATTFQDENIDQVLDIYALTKKMKIELATSALHNAFQFHKNDNYFYQRTVIAGKVEILITEMLKSWNIKNWFRAYLNLGLISKILGQERLHACTQGTDNVFLDPWGDVYACNVRNDLWMGNINNQTWDEVFYGQKAQEIRGKVSNCKQNCWMVSSAKTAMRSKLHRKVPKFNIITWVINNKIKVTLGKDINFRKVIDYNNTKVDTNVVKRKSYLNEFDKKIVQPEQSRHYEQIGEFFNK